MTHSRTLQRRPWPDSWSRSLGPALVVADLAAVLLAGTLTGSRSPVPDAVSALAAALVVGAAGLHRSRLVLSLLDELPALLVAATVATAVQLVGPTPSTSGALAAYVGAALGLLVVGHALVHGVVHLLRRTGRLHRRVVVVGCGPAGRELAETLQERPDYGLSPVGFVSTGDEGDLGRLRGLPLTLLGAVDALPRAMAETAAEAVVVALPGPAGAVETAAVRGCLDAPGEVYAVARGLPGAVGVGPPERIGHVELVRLEARPAPRALRRARRALTGLAAAVSLVCLVPLLLVLSVPVLIETGGVLVRRARGGEDDGRAVWRFRTERARSVARPGTTWSVAVTGRTGPVGRVLRRTRLVELPELAHVLLDRLAPGAMGRRWLPTAPGADEAQVDAGQLTS